MEELIIWGGIIGFIVIVAGVGALFSEVGGKTEQRYTYSRKESVMTNAEWRFFERLNSVAAGKYHVFPQIHLSSLLKNETRGKYYKLSYQRINRRSVDFILCDIETRRPVYSVELDDWSHDSAKRKARDSIVEGMLAQGGIPLVRFRNVNALSDEDIIAKFRSARQAS